MVRFGSIREIHRALVADGYKLSEYALRVWVKGGLIPAVYSGKKAYIRYDSVVDFLSGNAPQQPA